MLKSLSPEIASIVAVHVLLVQSSHVATREGGKYSLCLGSASL